MDGDSRSRRDWFNFINPALLKCRVSYSDNGMLGKMVSILVNGEALQIASDATVENLIAQLKLNPKFLAVELNRRVVPRAKHRQTRLVADDQVEIVTLVGGG
jgi:sulfur carrier protein